MSRSRGDLAPTHINREYPYQVVLCMTDWHRKNLIRMLHDRERLGGYRLWGSVRGAHSNFTVGRFPTREGQEEFIRLYGGVSYEPADKKSNPWETYFEKCATPKTD